MRIPVTQELLDSVRRYVDNLFEEESVLGRSEVPAREVVEHCLPQAAQPYADYACFEAQVAPVAPSARSPRRAAKPRAKLSAEPMRSIDEVIDQLDDTFSQALFRLIDQRGLEDPEVYKRARVDRKLFSKIRSNNDYQPSKNTALCLALALELSLDEALDLIGRAGFTLTHASRADIVVEYFITHECWDIQAINEVLYKFGLPTL